MSARTDARRPPRAQVIERLVVVGVGAALVAAVLVGRAGLLVRPWFLPLLAGAGVLLVLAGLRHDGGGVRRTTIGVLLLPVVAGMALTPGVAARAPAGAPTDGSAIESRLGEAPNPLLAGGGGQVTLLQVVLAEREVGAAALDGRAVTLEATVDGGGQLSRLVMVCCAADARPVRVPVRGSLPATGTWVRATGRLVAAGATLVLDLTSVTPIDVPARPLL